MDGYYWPPDAIYADYSGYYPPVYGGLPRPWPHQTSGDEAQGPPVRPEGSPTSQASFRASSEDESDGQFNYRVKLINPKRKSDYVTRDVHQFHGKFTSIKDIRDKLMNDFKDHLLETDDFQIGYYLGKQSSKMWLVTEEDLKSMYGNIGRDNILLWSDARSNELVIGQKRKALSESDPTPPLTKRRLILHEVDQIVTDLKDRHGADKFSMPQLRIWAHMIDSGNYTDRDNPPQHPAFDGTQPKRPKKPSLSEAIMEAANCFSQRVHTTDIHQSGGSNAVLLSRPQLKETRSSSEFSTNLGISPGKITELRIKKLQELRELQQLLEQNVLTEEEFSEQKAMVLSSLRKLAH